MLFSQYLLADKPTIGLLLDVLVSLHLIALIVWIYLTVKEFNKTKRKKA
jgi:uncharacterized membrane protein